VQRIAVELVRLEVPDSAVTDATLILVIRVVDAARLTDTGTCWFIVRLVLLDRAALT